MHTCPACKHQIRGRYISKGIIMLGAQTAAPSHCDNCSDAFPWTIKKTKLAVKSRLFIKAFNE